MARQEISIEELYVKFVGAHELGGEVRTSGPALYAQVHIPHQRAVPAGAQNQAICGGLT